MIESTGFGVMSLVRGVTGVLAVLLISLFVKL